MKRPLHPEEVKVWAVVARTVRPAAGRTPPSLPEGPAIASATPPRPVSTPLTTGARLVRKPPSAPPEAIEPGRKRRIVRARDPIEARLDLHGMDQDRARARLHGFLRQAHADGLRAVLVITGMSQAERAHGGEGALYVALKRRR